MNSTSRWTSRALALLLAIALPAGPQLQGGTGDSEPCAKCGKACPCGHLVACTIMVPTKVVETRIQSCVVYTQEQQTEEYTVFVRTPKERTYSKTCWYLKDTIEKKEVTEERCAVVKNPVVREYKVQVPVKEMREFNVPKEGCSQTDDAVGGETCQREVTVLQEEPRSCTTEESQVVFQTTKRDMYYCIKEPKDYTVECGKETVYELQPKTEKRTVCVCVPKIEQRPVNVEVCKLLPQTIYCCATCAKHCGRR